MHIIMLTQLEATIGRQQAEDLLLTITDCRSLAARLGHLGTETARDQILESLRLNLEEAETLADGLRALLEG